VSPEDGKRPQETKRQAVTRLFRQKTDSKSRNHLRSSRRYKITHLRRGSLNDTERLSQDPTLSLIGSEKIRDRGAALPSRLHWFKTQVPTQTANLGGLAAMNRELIAKAEGQFRGLLSVYSHYNLHIHGAA
jgi:hypothetical protein